METRNRTAQMGALAFFFIGALLITSCSSNKSPTSSNNPNNPLTHSARYHTVSIQNFSFNPASLAISAGDTVVWGNNDGVAHTVTSNSGAELGSGPISPGSSYRHIFAAAGVFAYHCSIHTTMMGSVTAQ